MPVISRLNSDVPLLDRLAESLRFADRLDIAVAYAKQSGVDALLQIGLPARSRILVGTGFGLTDPAAVEQLEAAGAHVRVFVGVDGLDPAAFHPKLYLVWLRDGLHVLSGSGNLTRAGLVTNVEQYEDIALTSNDGGVAEQHVRFNRLWALGVDLDELRARGAWAAYAAFFAERAAHEQARQRADRQVLDRLRQRVERPRSRRAAKPGFLTKTNLLWWEHQMTGEERPIFWRKRTDDFKVLDEGGLFFHLIGRGGTHFDRTIEGFSIFSGEYEVMHPTAAWKRHGRRLGVPSASEIVRRLELKPDDNVGLIHLERPRPFLTQPTLGELDDAGVTYKRQIVGGRGLDDDEVSTILALARAS